MSLTKLTKDLSIISKLSDEPNDIDGLTADELKAKFDEAGNSIKDYLNNTMTPELDAAIEEIGSDIEAIGEAAQESYKKPDGGIPKTDLDSAVQTSLDKADSALQSVPSTYRTAAAQDVIDAAQDAQIEIISHRNLLDNWYFVGGGSQNGVGVFPINQRGASQYPNQGYCFDRWYSSGLSTIYLNDSSVGMRGSGGTILSYTVEGPQKYAGKKLLFSVNGYVDTPNSYYLAYYLDGSYFGSELLVNGITSLTVDLTNVSTIQTLQVLIVNFADNASCYLSSAKLEIGEYQTLAHPEDDGNGGTKWVDNELPDYGEELAKCQRYYVTFPLYSVFTKSPDSTTDIVVCLPVPMASAPTTTGNISGITAWSTVIYSPYSNQIRIRTSTDVGVPVAGSLIEFSSEL